MTFSACEIAALSCKDIVRPRIEHTVIVAELNRSKSVGGLASGQHCLIFCHMRRPCCSSSLNLHSKQCMC